MPINAVQGTATSPAASRAASLAESREGTKLAQDFDSFLKLLTTQLQTQDPMAPMDAEQFTSQLVQFSAVEQAIQTNNQLESLVGLMRTTQHTAALQLVGATVELDESRTYLPTGGGAGITYTLGAPAAAVTVTIVDADGKTVRELEGPTSVGDQAMTWDGTDADRRGRSSGSYGVRVEALDAAGRPVPVAQASTGRVDALLDEGDGPVLSIGGRSYPLDAVRAVRPLTVSDGL